MWRPKESITRSQGRSRCSITPFPAPLSWDSCHLLLVSSDNLRKEESGKRKESAKQGVGKLSRVLQVSSSLSASHVIIITTTPTTTTTIIPYVSRTKRSPTWNLNYFLIIINTDDNVGNRNCNCDSNSNNQPYSATASTPTSTTSRSLRRTKGRGE